MHANEATSDFSHLDFADAVVEDNEPRVYMILPENRFKLDPSFVITYIGQQPDWGFGLLSYVTYKRTYARPVSKAQLADEACRYLGLSREEAIKQALASRQETEEFWQTCVRVVEGISSVYKQHIRGTGQHWNDAEEQQHAQEMFRRMWALKFTPPGRGLWGMGTVAMEKKGSGMLNNCGFVSTQWIGDDFVAPFTRLMDFLMLGVGMGFDILGSQQGVRLQDPKVSAEPFVVPDTREGWIACLRLVLGAFVGINPLPPGWDVSKIRAEGTRLRTFGGTASGPGPLLRLINSVQSLCYSYVDRIVDDAFIVDVMNMIGVCVVAGNVRRSSEIAIGTPKDKVFLALKDDTKIRELRERLAAKARSIQGWEELNSACEDARMSMAGLSVLSPEYAELRTELSRRESALAQLLSADVEYARLQTELYSQPYYTHRWASNNTANCEVGATDYDELAEHTIRNGEPGYGWPEIYRAFGRMKDAPNHKDKKAMGFNPCQPSEALVLTPDGIRTFGDIDVGSTVWSGQQWTRVIAKYATGTKAVYRYRTAAGSFLGTENHRVVSDGTKVEVRDAEAIDIALGNTASSCVASHDAQAIVDGLVLGDGYCHHGRIKLFQGAQDGSYDESEVATYLGSAHRRSDTGIVTRDVRTTLTYLPKTYEREIPDGYFKANSQVAASFLRGLYSANGSVVRTRITLKAASRMVIDQAQAMLSSLGISSYVTTNAAHDVEFENGLYTCRESYDLNIGTRAGREAFRKNIGFIQPYKQVKLDQICDAPVSQFDNGGKGKRTYPITSVELIGEMPVFDITVEAEEHTYWSNGLLVSNCGEQTLHDGELCCLVETYPTRHESLEDYLVTLKYAYRYAKGVTLIPTHDAKTNAVMVRNRRIGTSMAGIIEMYCKLGLTECKRWWDKGYQTICEWDAEYSAWLGVNESIKKTSIKPGGSTPLLVGVEGGMKLPNARYYMRTIRIDHISPLIEALRNAGFRVEKDRTTPRTMVAYFPCKAPEGVRLGKEMSLWEQAAIFTALQSEWSDNMVSATLTFQPHERPDVARVLKVYEGQWKCVSFLPFDDHGYEQAPYIPCTEAEYAEAVRSLRPVELDGNLIRHEDEEKYCSGGVCELPLPAESPASIIAS